MTVYCLLSVEKERLMKRSYISIRQAKKTTSRKVRFVEVSFQEAVEQFITSKQAEGMRERTINDYKSHIQYFLNFLKEADHVLNSLSDLTPSLIREYILYMKTCTKYKGFGKRERVGGLSPHTINIRIRSLQAMCNFWVKEGYLEESPMKNIRQLKTDNNEVKSFTDEEIRKLLSGLNSRKFAEWRDKILILLLLDTGMRINEACSLKFEDLDTKQSFIFVQAENEKTRRGRIVPVDRKLMSQLIELYEESCSYFGETEFIFMNAYGEPYNTRTFRKRLERLRKKVGVRKATPHMFRHTFIRDYLLNGGDLFTLQKIVGHSDIQTTKKYVQVDHNHIKQQHEKYSPSRKFI